VLVQALWDRSPLDHFDYSGACVENYFLMPDVGQPRLVNPDASMESSQFVWCNQTSTGRNIFCLFLRRFHLESLPEHLGLHLFADSLYRLHVNGKIVGFGPARFLPAKPEYDSYDLGPWLKAGQNTLFIEVNSRGAPCFQAVAGQGGFIAWGDEGGTVDFKTPGEWLVSHSQAWEPKAESFSFAQGPIEILDLQRLPAGYPSFPNASPGGEWSRPIEVVNAAHWGAFSPRAIAMPSLDVLPPKQTLLACSAREDHQRFGFNAGNDARRVRQSFFTHIYSPSEQTVDLGLFWGPVFLNGQKLKTTSCELRGNRLNACAQLRSGWNFLFGMPGLMQPSWTWIMELPVQPDLLLRALPEFECKSAFCLGPVSEQSPDVDILQFPASLGELVDYPSAWKFILSAPRSWSPGRTMAWDLPGETWVRGKDYDGPMVFTGNHEAYMITLDMGSEYLGHARVSFETERDTILDIGYADSAEANGTLCYYRSNPWINSGDRFICKAGIHDITTYHERGGRFLQLTFRNRPGGVKLKEISVILTTGEHRTVGHFRSDDELFNWTWKAGVATLRASMADGWIDPWRERGMYIGDALIEAPATRKFTDDWRMEPWAIRLWARGQFPNGQIPDVVPSAHEEALSDYTLLWIVLVRNYWSATGDTGLVREVWPAIKRALNSTSWREGHAGLWEIPKGCIVFVDWGALLEDRQDLNGCLNALRIHALECSAELARALEIKEEADGYAHEAKAVRKSFREVFWDSAANCFRATLVDGKLSQSRSLHVNSLALAFGLADERQEATVVDYLKREMPANLHSSGGHLELYFLYYLLLGLYRVGETGFAETVIRQHYGLMKESGTLTFWETLRRGLNKPSLDSVCHGWSCSPMIFFSERILGVREFAPGDTSRVLIAPESETLNEAAGRVPHPLGIIDVSWRIEGERLLLTTSLPDGVTAHIQPVGRLAGFKLIHSASGTGPARSEMGMTVSLGK
jgi:alpha-L-rhamnosidase